MCILHFRWIKGRVGATYIVYGRELWWSSSSEHSRLYLSPRGSAGEFFGRL